MRDETESHLFSGFIFLASLLDGMLCVCAIFRAICWWNKNALIIHTDCVERHTEERNKWRGESIWHFFLCSNPMAGAKIHACLARNLWELNYKLKAYQASQVNQTVRIRARVRCSCVCVRVNRFVCLFVNSNNGDVVRLHSVRRQKQHTQISGRTVGRSRGCEVGRAGK